MFHAGCHGTGVDQGSRGPDGRDWIIACCVAAAATAFHLLYFNHGVHNLVDLALCTVDSVRILDGEVYGLDFQAPYGPLRYYLIAGIFALFGQSLFVLNALFLAVMAVNSGLLFWVTRYLAPRPYALFAAFLGAVAHGSIHKSFFILSALLLIQALFLLIKSGGIRGRVWLGLVLCTVLLLRWDVGLVGLAAAAAVLWIMGSLRLIEGGLRSAEVAGKTAAGFLVLFVPVAASLFFFSDPVSLVLHTHHRITMAAVARTDFPSWSALFLNPDLQARIFTVLALMLFLALVGVLVMGLVDLARGRNRREALLLVVLALVGLPLFNQVNFVIRFNRLLQAAPLCFAAVAFLLHGIRSWTGRKIGPERQWAARAAAVLAATGLSLLLLFYLWNYTGLASQDSFAALRYRERFVDHPRIRCYLRTGMAKELEETLAYIEKKVPEEGLFFAGPSAPLLYFLAGKANPIPYTDWPYYYLNPSAERRAREALEGADVELYIERLRPVAGKTFEAACPLLNAYLMETFHPVKANHRFRYWERR